MTLRLASETPDATRIWAAYDRAMLDLHAMYSSAQRFTVDERLGQARKVERLRRDWLALFEDTTPGTAA